MKIITYFFNIFVFVTLIEDTKRFLELANIDQPLIQEEFGKIAHIFYCLCNAVRLGQVTKS